MEQCSPHKLFPHPPWETRHGARCPRLLSRGCPQGKPSTSRSDAGVLHTSSYFLIHHVKLAMSRDAQKRSQEVFLKESNQRLTQVFSTQGVKPHSHIHDLQPRSTTTQQSWSIVVSLQIIFNSRMTVWRVCTSRIEVSGGYNCFENFKTVVVDRRHLHKQVRANR